MADGVAVYISIMKDSLREKEEVLEGILAQTKEQERILEQSEMDTDAFERTLAQKGKLIKRMQQLDDGFNGLYQKIETGLKANKEYYKPHILEMQNMIRLLTDYSVKIQTLENKNKAKFESFVSNKRKEIRDFNVNSKTANSYYQNMANQHHQWQSYFMDKKN